MIKSVIYDLDLMLHFTPMKFSKYFSAQYNIPFGAVLEFFMNEFQDCIIGKADLKEEVLKYLVKWKWDKGVDEFLRIWHEYGYVDEDLVDIAKKLKSRNIKCILSTNNEKYRMEYFNRVHGFDKIFTKILNSWEVGYKKPETGMFDKIVKVSDAKKDEILFCDDKPDFIEAGKKFGFKTHHYTDLVNFREDLKKYDILV